jgi:hypothetical protein
MAWFTISTGAANAATAGTTTGVQPATTTARTAVLGMSPDDSDDLTVVIEGHDGKFIVLRSADDAEDSPDYKRVLTASSVQRAQEWIDEQ